MITHIETTQDADRARAELEEEWNKLHNSAAASWHQTKELGYKEASQHTEKVEQALINLKHLEALLIWWQERPCSGSPNECTHMVRADDQCRTAALPHEAKCDEHMAGESRWSTTHEEDDCCLAHCDGAEHTVDSIVTKEAA